MSRAVLAWLAVPVLLAAAADDAVMGLDACVQYAREHSRELAKRQLAVDAQRFNTLIRRGKFRPTLNADATHEVDAEDTRANLSLRQEFPAGFVLTTALRGTNAHARTDSADASVRLSKVILGGGSYRESMLDIDNSVIDEMIQLNLVHRYQRELAFQVQRDYYRLIRNHQTLRINEMRLERSKRNLEHAEERQRPLDIATAQIEVPDNESAVLRAQREIQSALDALKVLIGMDIDLPLAIQTEFTFAVRPVDVDADIAFCRASHEDVLNEGLRRRKIENEVPVQRARNWPKVTVSGGSTRRSDDGMNLGGATDHSVGVALAWEIGSSTERYRLAKLLTDLESKEIDIADLMQTKARSIRDLARRLDETLLQIDLQRRKIDLAQLRVNLYLDRWQNGEIDILEYIRSQNELENSRIQLINSQTTYMELLGEYDFTVGR